MLLQKGGDFMTLIRNPFKKRSTVHGDGTLRSPSGTPKSVRGTSMGRSSSVASSVNSDCDLETNNVVSVVDLINACSTKNIYADIDEDQIIVSQTDLDQICNAIPPELPAANQKNLSSMLQVPMISECEYFEECLEETEDDLAKSPDFHKKFICSKNNLLLMDDLMVPTSSISDHLNSIDKINKNLDKLVRNHHLTQQENVVVSTETSAKKKTFKEKIVEKMHTTKKETKVKNNGEEENVEESSMESLKSGVKNLFSKSEKAQESTADEKSKEKPKSSTSFSKGVLASFRKKQTESIKLSIDEDDEIFEEVSKGSDSNSTKVQITDLDSQEQSSQEHSNFTSKFTKKLKMNMKSTKDLITSRLGKKSAEETPELLICSRCTKRLSLSTGGSKVHPSNIVFDFNKELHTETLFNEDFCVCVNREGEGDDEGLIIKNLVYKDVSNEILVYSHAN